MDVVRALRSQASNYAVFADALDGVDDHAAEVLREEAVHLRCRAVVIEELMELYNDLGEQARRCSDFVAEMSGPS
nr:hypothetical protein [Kibdelosporangium sp. MJ126-NF4]CEL21312.1 hypothetical protein [Kibdelosporangium sp. MJ126-NF4]CTQ96121.1 hypothetical protein [Kibdelosporangium sp. MJ126-NF4]